MRRLDLYVQFERRLSDRDLELYRQLIGQRGKGRPVAYLIGHREFMKLEFEVTDKVLVPNPDTEVLVLRAIEWCRGRPAGARVADVGTGSGCIGVAVAHYVPDARVWAGDDDPAALEVARRNVRKHGLEDRVTLLEGDLLEPFPGGLDLVCANLPYVSRDADLGPDVLAQPGHALFPAGGGAALVRRLLAQAPAWLTAAGVVLTEVDPSIAGALEGELAAYAGHRFHKDLGGHTRALEAWR
jgi:release factor glutamine methyltransferase